MDQRSKRRRRAAMSAAVAISAAICVITGIPSVAASPSVRGADNNGSNNPNLRTHSISNNNNAHSSLRRLNEPVGQYGQCTDDANCEGDLVCHPNKQQCTCDTLTGGGCHKPGQICGVSDGVYCPQEGCLPSCSCDWDSDADDGSNGCDAGEVCREPCAIVDAGHMCFKSNEERDCNEFGTGYMCRDSNGDGKIDKMDGASGCVPQLVQPETKIEAPSLIIAGMVDDGGDDARDQPEIIVDPLDEMETHPLADGPEFLNEDGSTVSETTEALDEATAGDVDQPEIVVDPLEEMESHPPSEEPEPEFLNEDGRNTISTVHVPGPIDLNDPNLPNTFTFQAVIKTTATEAPAEGNTTIVTTTSVTSATSVPAAIETASTAGAPAETNTTIAATTSVTSTGSVSAAIETTRATEAPAEENTTIAPTISATSTENATSTSNGGHEDHPDDSPKCEWHYHMSQGNTCTNSPDYHSEWDQDDLHDHFLFATAEECCTTRFPDAEECLTIDECTTSISSSLIQENEADITIVSDCRWYFYEKGSKTCSNSENYPVVWDSKENSAHTFYATAEDCCQVLLYPNDADECIMIDDCTPNVIELHPNQLLTDIPWIFGDHPQWRYDDSTALAGDVNADSRSVTNIPIEGELGATADLSLKLMVPDRATLICAAKIDVHMPFDFFTLIVNGERTNQYYESFMDGDEWAEIKTELLPGLNRIIFRVKASDFSPGFDRQGQYGDYGSGRVWLDQCRIISHA